MNCDPAGMVTKISREDGTSTEYEYDALNRLIREIKQKEAEIITTAMMRWATG
jgi:YD repeat-containing protein